MGSGNTRLLLKKSALGVMVSAGLDEGKITSEDASCASSLDDGVRTCQRLVVTAAWW